jgi:hypothetical protein
MPRAAVRPGQDGSDRPVAAFFQSRQARADHTEGIALSAGRS